MATTNLWLVACTLAALVLTTTANTESFFYDKPSPAAAPSPTTVNCESVVYNMADCISYLIPGSNDTSPGNDCCTGFKSVLEVNCVCYALQSSANLGLEVDMKRAAALPKACGLSAPPMSTCNVTVAPVPAPASGNTPPPSAPAPPVVPPTPKSPASQAPAPSPSSPGSQAPAPGPSGAYTVALSYALHLMAIAASLCLLF